MQNLLPSNLHPDVAPARRLRTAVGIAVLAAGALIASAELASAQTVNGQSIIGENCMQKVFGTPVTSTNRLGCTANDIRLSRAISVSQASCIRGTKFNLTATFETNVTANSRYDAAFFFRVDGGSNARGDGSSAAGKCSLSSLTPPPPPNSPVLNLDNDPAGDLNSGTYNLTFTIPDVLCQDTDGDGYLNLPNCTAWHSNSSTFGDIAQPTTLKPETKSKCVCDDTFQVPVKVEQASIGVHKTPSPSQVPEPGGMVTYTVDVENYALMESVTIKTITDSIGKQLYDLSQIPVCDGTKYAICTPVGATSCASLIGTTLAPQATATCTFAAFAAGNAGQTVVDTVNVVAYQQSTNSDVSHGATATVTITDTWTAPTLQKTVVGAANCQLDATYQVVVSNNSKVDTLTVNSLADDKFGNVAAAHAADGTYEEVVSTTCVLPQTAIAPLTNYTCSFVGRITSTSCVINHTNKVTAATIDDDGDTATPSDDATLGVDVKY